MNVQIGIGDFAEEEDVLGDDFSYLAYRHNDFVDDFSICAEEDEDLENDLGDFATEGDSLGNDFLRFLLKKTMTQKMSSAIVA